MAALKWRRWTAAPPDAESLRTFAIITGEPNALVAPIHDCMPVFLSRLLRRPAFIPGGGARLAARAVSRGANARYPITSRVNFPRHDDAALIDEVAADSLPPMRPRSATDPGSAGPVRLVAWEGARFTN